jgi:membrane-bound lytic murein transglycosylase B
MNGIARRNAMFEGLRGRRIVLHPALIAAALVFAWPTSSRPAEQNAAAPTIAPAPPRPSDFARFIASLWPPAQARGVSRATFEAAFAGVTPDPAVAANASRQPEFDKPLQAYIEAAVTAPRLRQGADALTRWRAELARIEAVAGVPREIVVAVWGMETDFGADRGSKYVIRSLATLAFLRATDDSLRDEILAALDILQGGEATRATLLGSWAGAMGQPQFLPSAYAKYAVSFAGARAPDIWQSIPDSLASIANFLKLSGWQRGLPWGTEVKVPADFDYASLQQSFAAWTANGFRAAGKGALPAAGNATLFLPAGAGGPAFLLADNYWVIKAYNISDAYALSVAALADRLAGRPGIAAAWPDAPVLDRAARADVQVRLAELGFYHGKMDGKLGPEAREAIHAFQRAIGFSPADGYASPALLARLVQASGRPGAGQIRDGR